MVDPEVKLTTTSQISQMEWTRMRCPDCNCVFDFRLDNEGRLVIEIIRRALLVED